MLRPDIMCTHYGTSEHTVAAELVATGAVLEHAELVAVAREVSANNRDDKKITKEQKKSRHKIKDIFTKLTFTGNKCRIQTTQFWRHSS